MFFTIVKKHLIYTANIKATQQINIHTWIFQCNRSSTGKVDILSK